MVSEMAKWQQTLDLTSVFRKYDDGDMTIQQAAESTAGMMLSMPALCIKPIEEKRLQIADEFMFLSKDEHAEVSDFDEIMHRLYDWADTSLDGDWDGRKVCWVRTQF